MKKHFSIKTRMMIIFGSLIVVALSLLSVFVSYQSQRAVMEKVTTHLVDKATDTATVIDGRIGIFFQFLEGIARMPIFRDTAVSYNEKLNALRKEISYDETLVEAAIVDLQGNMYHTENSQIISVSDRIWFQTPLKGEKFVTEPFYSRATNKMILTFAIPVYNDNNNITAVLAMGILAEWLSEQIEDIVVGKTGECYILGLTGSVAAHKDFQMIENRYNPVEEAKKDTQIASLGAFIKHALEGDVSEVGYYEFRGLAYIASYATMKTTDWTIIIKAPVKEFLDTIDVMRIGVIIAALLILLAALITVSIFSRKLVISIQNSVPLLQKIAHGDFTVRLPVHGNDEISDMFEYFNETIAKIGIAIQEVGINANAMEDIGSDLASSMTETASAVHQISANIDGVKQQALTQSASVTETAATVEEIIRTIKQLNGSIENQAASVSQSSSAVEEMVANISSITQTLDKTNAVIKNLATATADGKETITGSTATTQKIAEESGSLLEASNVIQHIASQTNLLAMNAAIEAAHAGEAGKGFAVVADEIRKLAEESSAQGKSITATLKNLSGEIEMLSDSSKTAGEKFNAIFNLSGQVKDMSNQLMEAMKEQENGSREVLSAIKTINAVTNEVQAGSQEMLKGGEGVAEEMQKLDSLTHIITESMNEMASGAVQINNAVQEVSEITQKNKQSIDSLVHEVSKFKV